MAEPIGSAASGHPDLNLSIEEKQVYGELLKEADPDGFGAVSGDVAVKFFERTKLPPDVLGQVWQIADTENRGFLTPAGFGVVLRLIGHAQAGRVPAASLAPQPAPLPKFDSNARLPPATVAAPLISQPSGVPPSPTSSGPGPIRVPALGPEKVNEYASLFEKSGAENGTLPGLIAKQIFERARLPNEVLGRIWNLADVQGRGALDVTEFVIAMHLLASYKSGQMRGVPTTLPPGLYDAAARRPPPRTAISPRPGSGSGMVPQFTGYSARPQSPVVRQQPGTSISAQSTGDGWAISPVDKARFDQIFATIDRQGYGHINGEQAVAFFGNARLPEESLAQIWDLADINSEGRLNREEFAVAMYLIRQQRGTKDGRGNLPSTLPPALIPPSMRKQVIPPSQPTAPAFENAPVNQPKSAAEDLFGLDVLSPTQPMQPTPSTATAPTQVPQSTGGTDNGLFGTPKSPTVPSAAAAVATSIFKPFQPSSSFGQSMIPQSTGSPSPNQTRSIPIASVGEDLLGDTDANVSSKLTNETAELGNLSNQVGSLSREMTDLQGKRAQADQEVSQNAQQKRTFETRLTQLRVAFDKEVQEYKALQEQLTTSRNENKRLQQDIAMIEGSHADTKRQHEQLRTAYEADQQEMTSLKEKIRKINAENDTLKPQIEKLKSDARQQKGLVAINKKQLATNELERDRLQNELKAAQKEIDDAVRELQETSRQVEASNRELDGIKATPKPSMPAHTPATAPTQGPTQTATTESRGLPLATPQSSMPAHTPATAPAHVFSQSPTMESRGLPLASPPLAGPPLASPTPSMTSNPFMKRDGSAVFSPPVGSPEPTHDHSAFDSIFGPSFGAATTAAPATSFGSETPTNQTTSPEHFAHQETGTPTSSIAPDIVEPPAPPAGEQITSKSLPFRTNLGRTDSMTSSVKVVPPASRLSPADTPRAMTPSISTPGTDQQHTDPFAMAAPDEEQESVRRSLPRTDTNEKAADIPGAFPVHTPRSETPAQDVNPTAIAVGAGAAAVAAGAGLAAIVAHKEDEKQKDTKADVPTDATKSREATNFDEYFGGPAHQRTPSEQVKDFDDAFAGMKNELPATNGTTKAAPEEFPAIQQLDDSDDSSVYSEETPLGFDDDFNAKPTISSQASGPAVPSSVTPSSRAAGKQPEVAPALPAHLLVRPPLESTSSNASSLPGIEQQTSPPTYKDSVPEDNPSHFPREYKGLLPEREDPTSPPLTAGGSTLPGPNPAGMPPTYGPEVVNAHGQSAPQATPQPMIQPIVQPATQVTRQTETSAATKPSAFDFDSAFAGMGPAQVEEDDSDEAETTFGSRPSQVPEFDPSFGSPAQSRTATVASTTHSPMTTHSAVTTHDAVTNGQPTNPKMSSNSFFGFNDSIVTSPPAPMITTNAPEVSHDWDALFAPLSSTSATAANTGDRGVEPQRTEISPLVNARTSATEISGTSTPIPHTAAPTIPLPPSSLRVERPQPGRALSTGTEHDDPILKQLTAMGWGRDESLAALEKFDYNIDKAADYLTFKS